MLAHKSLITNGETWLEGGDREIEKEIIFVAYEDKKCYLIGNRLRYSFIAGIL